MNLNEILPGESCKMVGLTAEGALERRLMDLGFYPGATVKIIRNAPLIDPVEIQLEGVFLAIRHAEAERVEVDRDGL
ncbi:MAG: ferrous iron transport protein A [Deltaproteobacteria bacterium]|jgi:ferrous iron transport protein A|nr:ferrous iron transport protein A [Deltaproteobacteria bacterium]